MIRKFGLALLALIAVLVLVIAANTLMVRSRQVEVPVAPEITIDELAAAKRLSGAVRFATISYSLDVPADRDAFLGLHDFLAASYPMVHSILRREVIGDYSLLYTWQGTDPGLKPILLMGHLDVVPVEPEAKALWQHPPFSGEIADGYVWGRGTLDDKVSVLAALEAVEHLLGQGFAPTRSVYLAFGHDEEIDGPEGAAKISRLLAVRNIRFEFTLDEGTPIVSNVIPGIADPVALIGVAEKGYLALKIVAEGEGGHSSMPPRNTAIGKLARVIRRLESKRMPAAIQPPVLDMFDFLAPEASFPLRILFANRWLFEPVLIAELGGAPATNAAIRSTTAVTMVTGGVKPNVLPKFATAVVDFRILPSETIEQVVDHVRAGIDAVVDSPTVTVQKIGLANEPPPISEIESRGFRILQKTVHQIFPDVIVAPSLVIAGTDSKHYADIADNNYRFLPTRLTPDDILRIHGDNERIAIENFGEIIQFYIQLLRNSAS